MGARQFFRGLSAAKLHPTVGHPRRSQPETRPHPGEPEGGEIRRAGRFGRCLAPIRHRAGEGEIFAHRGFLGAENAGAKTLRQCPGRGGDAQEIPPALGRHHPRRSGAAGRRGQRSQPQPGRGATARAGNQTAAAFCRRAHHHQPQDRPLAAPRAMQPPRRCFFPRPRAGAKRGKASPAAPFRRAAAADH